jgi:hypothetical protein
METHPVYGQGTENLETLLVMCERLIRRITQPQASGSSLRTVVVFSSAKKAPRCIHLKWLIYRCQFSFSATIVKPAACCRSSPVGDTRFPVARKFANRAPISKFMRPKTLWRYRSSNERQSRYLGLVISLPSKKLTDVSCFRTSWII